MTFEIAIFGNFPDIPKLIHCIVTSAVLYMYGEPDVTLLRCTLYGVRLAELPFLYFL